MTVTTQNKHHAQIEIVGLREHAVGHEAGHARGPQQQVELARHLVHELDPLSSQSSRDGDGEFVRAELGPGWWGNSFVPPASCEAFEAQENMVTCRDVL